MFFRKKKSKLPKEFGKRHLVFLICLLFASVGVWAFRNQMKSVTLEVQGQKLEILVAATIRQQYTGLGGRVSLEEYDGMIFPFGWEGKHTIVMRDMQFPIDIVWLSYDTVVDIAPRVPIEPGVPDKQLFQYQPRIEATAVLELPAGKAEELHLSIGDTVRLVEEEKDL